MRINKIIITKGIYLDRELRLLVSFDENNKPIDLVNIDITKIGEIKEATVEKVLKDIDACIVKFDSGEKGFIENRKLRPEFYTVRHSDKKLVCQGDKFFVQISQDKKGSKPYSCNFIENIDEKKGNGFLNYFTSKFCSSDTEIITDISEYNGLYPNIRIYSDDSVGLWQLYGLTSILDDALNKRVYLKNGGNIVIEPTEALTVIDVNTGSSYGKSQAFDTNIQAIKEIASQLRLRSISGIIIIDLLKVSKEDETRLMEYAKECFSNDISSVIIHGFTNLGLMEVTRTRIIAPFSI